MGIQEEVLKVFTDAMARDNGSYRLVANRIGIPEPTLRNWLSGRRNPMTDVLAEALDALNVHVFTEDKAKTVAPGEAISEGELQKNATLSSFFPFPMRNAVTKEEKTLREENEMLKDKISNLSISLASSETEAKSLKEQVSILKDQVSMLYSLLSGGKLSLTCKNINTCSPQQVVGGECINENLKK